jgi:hypothetical protein
MYNDFLTGISSFVKNTIIITSSIYKKFQSNKINKYYLFFSFIV